MPSFCDEIKHTLIGPCYQLWILSVGPDFSIQNRRVNKSCANTPYVCWLYGTVYFERYLIVFLCYKRQPPICTRVCRWVIYETFSKTSLTFRHPQKWTQWCQCQRHWPFYRLYPCLGLILCNPGRSPRSTGRPGRSCSCLDACSPYYDRTVQEWLW